MSYSCSGEAIVTAYLFNQPSYVLFYDHNFKIKLLFSLGEIEDVYMLFLFPDVT